MEFIRPLENVTVTENQSLKLGCILSKDNCHVIWLKDEEEITTNDDEDNRYIATNDGRSYRLEIKESKMRDAGMYTIKVEDKQQSCQVNITGKGNSSFFFLFIHDYCLVFLFLFNRSSN